MAVRRRDGLSRRERWSGAALLVLPVVFGFVIALLRPSGAHASDTPPPTGEHAVEIGPLPPKDIDRTEDPQRIYLRDCAVCHGADATGTPRGPSLFGQGRAGVYFWLSTGRMPVRNIDNINQRIGRRPPLYPQPTLNRLIDYVVGLIDHTGPDIPDIGHGSVSDGLHLFSLECAGCHAWSGSGSIMSNGKVPTVEPANAQQVAAAIRTGPGQMPTFGAAAFDQQQLNDVVAYVETLRDKRDAGGWGIFHRGPTTEGAAALVLGLGAVLLAVGWIGKKAHAVKQ